MYIVHDELTDSEIPPPTFIFCAFQEEASFMKAAMDKVQSSYLRSLQEVGDLLKKRAETIKNLKIWAPSHTPNKDDYTPTIVLSAHQLTYKSVKPRLNPPEYLLLLTSFPAYFPWAFVSSQSGIVFFFFFFQHAPLGHLQLL